MAGVNMTIRSAIYHLIGFLAFAFACALFASAVLAGEISPGLESKIQASKAYEMIRVVIIPESDKNQAAFKSSLNANYKKLSDRRRAAIDRLKENAEKSQQPLKGILNSLEKTRQAKNIKYFWIDNLIEAEIRSDKLKTISNNPFVKSIEVYPEIEPVPAPKSRIESLSSSVGVEVNLSAINADSAWVLGYDGSGRIVCSFDSGVDGDHPALSSNYRGNKGYSARECWYPGVDTSTYPHDFPEAGTSRAHGTHTTGIMVGHDDATGDTIGVAPGADWIAALAIDVPGASIFDAFQWAADPDGNPNTVTDIPDVINHSYGIKDIGCSELFWGVIDNLEDGLGVVNVFSAGNEGNTANAIRSPANRAEDSITNFAIGAVYAPDSSIWSGSSRGPSNCDGISIKPNVVAPGQSVRSSEPNNVYAIRSGTSASAPHVSGAVAILRQKNPDATVDEIKTALLNSAHDLGTAGPDNTYGWGLIDIVKALEELTLLTTPSLQVKGFDIPHINPGDQLDLTMSIKNIGADAFNVIADFSNPETGVNLITTQVNFGTINRNGSVTGASPLTLSFDNEIEINRYYTIDMLISANGGYGHAQILKFYVGSRGERSYYTHQNETISFTISNYGAFGFNDNSYTPFGYSGFQFGSSVNDMYEGAFLLGTDSAHVSDGAHNVAQELDGDFFVTGGGTIQSTTSGIYSDQETVSSFDDSYAENPLGVSIVQKSYAWDTAPDDKFIILEYIITNDNITDITDLYAGLYFDWDINVWSQNHGRPVASEDLGYVCWASVTDSSDFRGVRALNPEGMFNHEILLSPAETYGSFFHEGLKFRGLAIDFRPYYNGVIDVAHITSTGPFSLSPGQSDTAAFSIIGGDAWDDFITNAQRAQVVYDLLPTDVNDDGPALPGTFALYQNFPNPFNPATTISFSLPKSGNVKVEVFDILGRVVKTLEDKIYPAGRHEVEWDGTDESGASAASGIYFYRVTYENTSLTRKMVLMK
ncbi:MAG: S8 family serine peptidase [Candidatus Zixiibacteriota bacterium]